MVPTRSPEAPARPLAFLVSTPGQARGIAGRMGCADYSYTFVLDALRPALDAIGPWEVVDRPESRLPYRASRLRDAGFRPIHLAIHPPHSAYLTPALPTVLFPFWEFPRIPDRPFRHDTRQDWSRVCQRADLIVNACEFTAGAFRRAGVRCPVAVVPVPIARAHFDLPDWDPDRETTLRVRHVVLGDEGATASTPAPAPPRGLRARYHRHIHPWLSEEAVVRLHRAKHKILRRQPAPPPVLPRTALTLSGLVYTSIFNLGDRRKNVEDIVTAFLLAFRHRPDATLVLKLATNPLREDHDLRILRGFHAGLGLRHRCRLVVVTDFLDDDQMAALTGATTYYVNASRAEGACLPLQQALAGGRPALAPAHTAMADYMDDGVGFVVESDPEPTYWPHDPDCRGETYWNRLNWESLRARYLESAEVAAADRPRYDALSREARDRIGRLASLPVAIDALRRALSLLPESPEGAVDWAA